MDDQRIGAGLRAIRIRSGRRQSDVALRAGVAQSTISRAERGHFDTLSLAAVRRIAATLDARIDVLLRWRGGELDRMLNGRHAALHESVAAAFRGWPGWTFRPEVSFAIYGERGVIDILAWHGATRALLAIELKTELVDVNELMGTLDRKRRLARSVARELGWDGASVSTWVVLAAGRTNRRRVDAHEAVLRAAFPATGPEMQRWLGDPDRPIAGLSTWAANSREIRLEPVQRVRPQRAEP